MPLYLFIFIALTVIMYICMYLSIKAEYERTIAEQRRLIAMAQQLAAFRPQMDAIVNMQVRRNNINKMLTDLKVRADLQFKPEKMAKVLKFRRKVLKFAPINGMGK